jgi:hypothetical protein
MMRHDYLLRMIAEFARALARITALRKNRQWTDANEAITDEFQQLLRLDAAAVVRLSPTELVARLVEAESTQVVREKTLFVVALLKEAGDAQDEHGPAEAARLYYLQGLRLLLGVMAQEDVFEWPEFVPTIEMLLAGLRGAPLPLEIEALLMQHYERSGQFDKAENALFALLEAAPNDPDLLSLGCGFYERLLTCNTTTLAAGNLPRAEVEAGLAELRQRAPSRG